MDKRNDGGPAFPQPPCPDCGVMHEPKHVPGMTLRDYFAGQALVGLMRDQNLAGDLDTAMCAYHYADAMLTARDAKEPRR